MAKWITKNGKRIRIDGGGQGVVAGVLALGMIASAGGAVSLGGGGAASVGNAGSGSSVQLRARKSEGQKTARKGDNHGAWQRLGLRQARQSLRQQAECLVVSFGEVREFFTRTRCSSLDRMMFAVVDDAGNTAVVSVVWVDMTTTGDASAFKTLEDRPGSGDISPLGAAALELADVTFTGLRYGSERDGKLVTVAEAENAGGSGFDHETLDAIAEVAAFLPRL